VTGAAALLATLLLAGPPTPAEAHALRAAESGAAAAAVVSLLRFTEWPPGALGPADAPIVIGLVGEGPLLPALEDAIGGQLVQGRPLALRLLGPADQDADLIGLAALVFTRSAVDGGRVSQRPALGVLTIGEGAGFLAHGGQVALAVGSRPPRVHVDPDAVGRAGLVLSPQLLRLAVTSAGRLR
jgi:hypothetical protein